MRFLALLLFCAAAHAEVWKYTDFVPLGKRQAGTLVAAENGQLASMWVMVPRGNGDVTEIHYFLPAAGPGYFERMELRWNKPTSSFWWYVTGYCSAVTGSCDALTASRVTLGVGGFSIEIGDEGLGHPYAPAMFTAPYTLTVVGTSAGTPFTWTAAVRVSDGAFRQDEVWTDLVNGKDARWVEHRPGRYGDRGNIGGWGFRLQDTWKY